MSKTYLPWSILLLQVQLQPSVAMTDFTKWIINLVKFLLGDLTNRGIIHSMKSAPTDAQVSAVSNLPVSISQRHAMLFRGTPDSIPKLMQKAQQHFLRSPAEKLKTERYFNGKNI